MKPLHPRLRTLLRGAGFLGVLLIGLAVLIVEAGSLLSKATERDTVYRYFDEALDIRELPPLAVRWLDPVTALDRQFGESEQTIVGRLLTRAWQTHAAALENNSDTALPDYFSGVALERASQSVAVTEARMVVLRQDARPVFFHLDGSLLQVRTDALVARFVVADRDTLAGFSVTKDTTLTTLVNEADGWRIISHERIGTQPLDPPSLVPVDGRLSGLNYYPALTPWTGFWSGFDPAIIQADFDLIAGLGATSVRVFLQRAAFLDQSTREKALTDLGTLLSEAERRGLSVVPTLFDLKGGYGSSTWANDVTYLQRVLPVLAGSAAVAYVDLKNEPDLDIPGEGAAMIEGWARTMLGAARDIAPELAYTIGWSGADAAPLLADTLDLISYHDYGSPDDSAAALAAVREIAGNRPVHVTEIGETSYSLVAGRFPSSPEKQASRLDERLALLDGADGIFVWALHDFPETDPAALGPSPWVARLQSQFGLISTTGSRKPVADLVETAFRRRLTDN